MYRRATITYPFLVNVALKSPTDSFGQPEPESVKSSENTSGPRSALTTVVSVTGFDFLTIPVMPPLHEAVRVIANTDHTSDRIRTVRFLPCIASLAQSKSPVSPSIIQA